MAGARYRFVFSGVRSAGKPLQLQEIVLRSSSGALLLPQAVTNPLGSSPPSQQVVDLFDQNLEAPSSKWLDLNFPLALNSTVEIILRPGSPAPASYELFTANDNPGRDPTAWEFARLAETGWEVLDRQQGVRPPSERL